MFEDVITYARLGIHRTGTDVDRRTADWIAGELAVAGLDTRFDEWRLRQFVLQRCTMEVYGRDIEGIPLWFPKATVSGPVRAPFHLFDDHGPKSDMAGRIVLMLPDSKVDTSEAEQAIRMFELAKAGALGIVICPRTPSGEVFGHNVYAPYNQEPWPIPVVMAGWNDRPALIVAAERQDEIVLTVEGRDDSQALARSVIGQLTRGDQWVVVSTPQSGWFRCGGERGPGVALMLALARWAAETPPGPSYLFLCNSGHELGMIGMDRILTWPGLPAPEQVIGWLHLGSSVATRPWTSDGRFSPQGYSGSNNLVASPDLLPVIQTSFAGLPDFQPRAGEARGELARVLARGYSGFGFFGGHYHFHTDRDGPENTAPALLEPVALALAEAIKTMIEQRGDQPASAFGD